MNEKKGSLIVIGSGIKAIGHFTLEAQAHIQQADIVLYAAADPVTDMWIEKQNPNSFDLYQYYGNDKSRIITYIQMVERILDEVRSGKYVCALFYGHPGVFVTPSHNAIEIARKEGYHAVMLPSVSAEDCLYADLGVDPSIPGLQIYEATDLLLRKRTIDTNVNLILFQVGCIGDLGFKFGGYGNEKFGLLIDYLEEIYGPDHIAINYVANMFAPGDPVIDRYRIADYRSEEIQKKVTGISTFFIAALQASDSDPEMREKLGLSTAGKARMTPLVCDRPDYPVLAQIAARNNYNHSVPEGYKYSFGSQALYDTLYTLALDYEKQKKFREDPRAYLAKCEGLTTDERRKLLIQHHGVTRMLFKRDPDLEAIGFVGAALVDPHLAQAYLTQQRMHHGALERTEISPADYEGRLAAWFRQHGFAATPAAVSRAMNGVKVMSTFDVSGTYMTSWQQTDGSYAVGPVIVVDTTNNSVVVDGVTINKPVMTGVVITWMASSSNPSSAVLSFYQNNNVNGFTGTYVEGSGDLPSGTNLYGNSATPSQELSTWNATYNTYNVSGSTSTADSTLVIADPAVTYNGKAIQNYVYTGESTPNGALEQLAWFTEGGNDDNVIIQFALDKSNDLTFYGAKWDSGNQPSDVNFTGTTASTPPSTLQIVVVLINVVSSTTQQQNTTTEVEVDVTVEVEVEVAVVDLVLETDGPSPGTQLLADAGKDGDAAEDLAQKAHDLSIRKEEKD